MHAEAALRTEPGFSRTLGHPSPLWMLLGVTVGVNFAFYGFRAFLAPYIAQAFYAHLTAAQAMQQADVLATGSLALVYATSLLGGYVADHFLGDTRALWLALFLQVGGIAVMASPTLSGFELGMALFDLGAGLAIPLTVLVGRSYGPDDPKRDAGFTLFYLAINFGAFVAPFICADWVGRHYGYRYGFLVAGLGILLAAIGFHFGKRMLGHVGDPPEKYRGPGATLYTLLGTALLVYPTYLLLDKPQLLSGAVYALLGLLVVYFVQSGIRSGDKVQMQRYIAMLLLFAANICFWALDLQGATSLNFLAKDFINAPFDFSWFQSFNPFYILILAPFLAILWPWLDQRKVNPSTPRKFGIGIILVGLSYLVMALAIRYLQGADGKLAWWTLALSYLLQTVGELTLSPIGYAMVTRLAAPHETSLAMGGWFLAIALSYDLSGKIAAMTTTGARPGIAGYGHVYWLLFLIGSGVGVAYLLVAPWITRLMHGAH